MSSIHLMRTIHWHRQRNMLGPVTSHEWIYKKWQKYAIVEDVFSHEDIVSGVISKAGNLLVCFEESRGKGIKVYPLILVMKLGVGNLIFGTQKLYHKTSIPMCIRAERNYWRIVMIFSYFWERRIQMITTQWEPWSVAAGGSEMIWEHWDYHCHSKIFY